MQNSLLKSVLLSSIFAVLFGSCLPVPALAATTFSFSPATVSVRAGQTFTVTMYADPAGVSNYTIKASIKFPPDLVSLDTWNFGSDWTPLRQPGYDSFDNAAGTLVRTAGFSNGFSSKKVFGTATFTVKKASTGAISFSGEQLALDENNANLYGSGSPVLLTVVQTPVSVPTSPTAATTPAKGDSAPPAGGGAATSTGNPQQLFDIQLSIPQPVIPAIADLVGRVSFNSFGSVPTPVTMHFSVLDAGKKVVLESDESVTVETQDLFNKQFIDTAPLPDGAYTLELQTLYRGDVSDVFTQPFEIRSVAPAPSWLASWWTWWVAALAALLLGLLLWFFLLGKRCRDCDEGDEACCRRRRLYGRMAIVFTATILGATLLTIAAAQGIIGSWTAVTFENGMPEIVIIAICVTTMWLIVRYAPKGTAARAMAIGFLLVALNAAFKLFVRISTTLIPNAPIRGWTFLEGAAEFIAVVLILIGLHLFLLHKRDL